MSFSKLGSVITILIFVGILPVAAKISSEDVNTFVEENYNPAIEKGEIPGWVINFFGNEKTICYIEREDGSILILWIEFVNGKVVEIREVGEKEVKNLNPTVIAHTNERIVWSIMRSDDPPTAFQIALRDGEIRVEGAGLVNWIKYSIGNAIMKIAGNIGILKSPYDKEGKIEYRGHQAVLEINALGQRILKFPETEEEIIINKYGEIIGFTSNSIQKLLAQDYEGWEERAGFKLPPEEAWHYKLPPHCTKTKTKVEEELRYPSRITSTLEKRLCEEHGKFEYVLKVTTTYTVLMKIYYYSCILPPLHRGEHRYVLTNINWAFTETTETKEYWEHDPLVQDYIETYGANAFQRLWDDLRYEFYGHRNLPLHPSPLFRTKNEYYWHIAPLPTHGFVYDLHLLLPSNIPIEGAQGAAGNSNLDWYWKNRTMTIGGQQYNVVSFYAREPASPAYFPFGGTFKIKTSWKKVGVIKYLLTNKTGHVIFSGNTLGPVGP